MPEEIYEVVALAMRYWFALLGVMIVWRSFAWLRKDRRARHRRLKRLPDAGLIGEMAVLRGSDELPEGSVLPMPYEGTIGFVRSCDVTVPVEGVAACHLDFSFQMQKGLLLYLRPGRTCMVDGIPLTRRDKPRQLPMLHGSTLAIGDAVLQLRLFEELDTMPKRPPAQTQPRDTLFGQEAQYPQWQETPQHPQTLFGQPVEQAPQTPGSKQEK